jgi:hypothetical protein
MLTYKGGWTGMHNEELHKFFASSNIIRVIKSRKIIWAGYVSRMGEMRMNSKFWPENLKGVDHSEYLEADGRIISER